MDEEDGAYDSQRMFLDLDVPVSMWNVCDIVEQRKISIELVVKALRSGKSITVFECGKRSMKMLMQGVLKSIDQKYVSERSQKLLEFNYWEPGVETSATFRIESFGGVRGIRPPPDGMILVVFNHLNKDLADVLITMAEEEKIKNMRWMGTNIDKKVYEFMVRLFPPNRFVEL